MKKLSFILALIFIFPFTAYGSDNSAQSAIVIDADTNTVLYEKNAYEQRAIASTTKIMTALLAIESNRLDETVTVTDEMLNTEGSSLGLKAGDKLTLNDLITGMMLTSGNDSANAVAYFVSGSIENFALLMNKRAEEIGMKNTYFVTPSGLDDGSPYSTAYDMALLACTAVKSDTFCEIVSKQSADIIINSKKITVYNHNKLLAMDKNIFGIKTGFTEKAGRCLVSARNYQNNKLICVTLCAPDDWNDHLSLYDECIKKYKKIKVKKECSIPVVGAEKNQVKCSYESEYYLLGEVSVEEYYYPFLYAPTQKGMQVGYAYIYCNKKLIERLPIEADEDLKYYVIQQRSTASEIYG
ncbi:MAG: D-alanyl-D-alanine carboxypeptidase family protein [Eubacterium sp.]